MAARFSLAGLTGGALLCGFLTRVFASINQPLQAARFVAGVVNLPILRRANGNVHCIARQLALENVRQSTRRRATQSQGRMRHYPK